MHCMSRVWTLCAAVLLIAASAAHAENGAAAWLRYERIGDAGVRQRYDRLSGSIATLDDSVLAASARDELIRGMRSLLGRQITTTNTPADAAIVLGTIAELRRVL